MLDMNETVRGRMMVQNWETSMLLIRDVPDEALDDVVLGFLDPRDARAAKVAQLADAVEDGQKTIEYAAKKKQIPTLVILLPFAPMEAFVRSLWPDVANAMARPLVPGTVRAVCLGDGGISYAAMPVDREKAQHAGTVLGTPSPGLRDVLEEIIEREGRLCLKVLQETLPALAARTVLTEMNARTEVFVEDLHGSGADRTDCREGCSWCCYGGNVEIAASEAVVIAEYLADNLDAEHLAQVRQRIAEDARDIRSRSTEERFAARVACPLLDEAQGRCLVYEVRPGLCRAYNSMDAKVCERAFKVTGKDEPIPFNVRMKCGYASALTGLERACKAHGVDARGSFQLSLALEVAFAPESGERWARGERIFDAAMLSSVDMPSFAGAAATTEEQRRRERNARKRERKKGRR